MKFLKRHIEINLNIVVAADANGFDELRNDHFLCLKGAGVEQICPCEQSVVFLPQILRRSQQRLIFCLYRVYRVCARAIIVSVSFTSAFRSSTLRLL